MCNYIQQRIIYVKIISKNNIKLKMSYSSENLFYQVCSKVANKVYLQQLMSKQQTIFDIQPFKIDRLHAETSKKLYNLVCFKYEVSKQYTVNPTLWYQNQRKLFIWFIVCFQYQNQFLHTTETNLDWELLSRTFFCKSVSFLQFQYKSILKQKHRTSWTQAQDDILIEAAEYQGPGSWNQISKYIYFNSNEQVFKSSKHCRQRWLNHLDQTKNKGKWTNQEDYKILTYIKKSGKKWSRIAQLLNQTRTEHMVKNRYNSLMSKVRKNKKQKQIETINKILTTLSSSLNISNAKQQKIMENQKFLLQSRDSRQLSQDKIQGRNILIQEGEELNEYIRRKTVENSLNNVNYNNGFQKVAYIQNFTNFDFNNIFIQYLNSMSLQKQAELFFFYGLPSLQQSQIQNLSKQWKPQQNYINQYRFIQGLSISYKTQPVYIIQQNGIMNQN